MAKAPAKKAQSKINLTDKAAKLSVGAKVGIFIATSVVVGLVFYSVAVVPFTEEATVLESSISQSQSEINNQGSALKKHEAVSKYAASINSAYEYIQMYLPKETEMPRLLQMVSEIGARAGLTDGVTLFAPRLPAIVQENYAEIPFTLNLEGEFLTVLSFLYDFSRINRIVNITQVSIGTPKMVDAQREIFHISVKCAGSTYRSLTEAEIEAATLGAAKKK